MRIAFIITKTPQDKGFSSFTKLLHLYQKSHNLVIYLLGNGVYCATHGHIHTDLMHKMAQKHEVLACQTDLLSRGIDKQHLIKGVGFFTDYDDLVEDLMEEIDQVFSF